MVLPDAAEKYLPHLGQRKLTCQAKAQAGFLAGYLLGSLMPLQTPASLCLVVPLFGMAGKQEILETSQGVWESSGLQWNAFFHPEMERRKTGQGQHHTKLGSSNLPELFSSFMGNASQLHPPHHSPKNSFPYNTAKGTLQYSSILQKWSSAIKCTGKSSKGDV